MCICGQPSCDDDPCQAILASDPATAHTERATAWELAASQRLAAGEQSLAEIDAAWARAVAEIVAGAEGGGR